MYWVAVSIREILTLCHHGDTAAQIIEYSSEDQRCITNATMVTSANIVQCHHGNVKTRTHDDLEPTPHNNLASRISNILILYGNLAAPSKVFHGRVADNVRSSMKSLELHHTSPEAIDEDRVESSHLESYPDYFIAPSPHKGTQL